MQPLINKKIKLEKIPGKGGWTFARVPGIKKDPKNPFGWKKVKGTIDGFEIKQYHLMPLGDGNLFLPVRAEIRKKIGKQEGDTVHVILFPDNEEFAIPDELILCLEDEPAALRFFNQLSQSEKRLYVLWIYSAKKSETKSNRIVKSIERLNKGLKLYEKELDY